MRTGGPASGAGSRPSLPREPQWAVQIGPSWLSPRTQNNRSLTGISTMTTTDGFSDKLPKTGHEPCIVWRHLSPAGT